MEKIILEFVLKAETPIAHASGNEGNASIFMREGQVLPGGEQVDVPIVTGDTMRHQLRESAAWLTLDTLGLLDTPSLTAAAVRLLFAGGGLGGSQGSSIDVAQYRAMMEQYPFLAILGGALGTRMVPGKLEVGRAVLICNETVEAGSVGDGWAEGMAQGTLPAADHLEDATRVRMDPMLQPAKRSLLTADEDKAFLDRLIGGGKGKKDESATTMMPRTTEVLKAGSLLYWRVAATLHTEAEVSAFWTMLGCALADLVVGGKRGTGHGRLVVLACRQVEWLKPTAKAAAINPLGISGEHVERFRAYLAERSDGIKAWLGEVDA